MADFRDKQRSKAYAFDTRVENLLGVKPTLSLDDCGLLVNICLAHFKMDPEKMPRIKDGRRCRRASAGACYVTLPKWSRDTVTVCHEAAHTVVWRIFRSHHEGHGAEWMRVYCHLLSKTHDISEAELVSIAKDEFKLRVAPACDVPNWKKKGSECYCLISS